MFRENKGHCTLYSSNAEEAASSKQRSFEAVRSIECPRAFEYLPDLDCACRLAAECLLV
jgi:hypothetical protein